MKAISIKQPWANWIIEGKKTIETRSHNRFKSLVGQIIAIHASKKWDQWAFDEAIKYGGGMVFELPSDFYPNGIIGTARVETFGKLNSSHEKHTLCFCEERFGLFLTDVHKFSTPIPWKGQQGIFNVPDETYRDAIEKIKQILYLGTTIRERQCWEIIQELERGAK